MSEKLLPCPFCGESNTYPDTDPRCDTQGLYVGRTKVWWVSCTTCGCEAPHGKTRTKAIAAWNTRVDPSRQRLVEALQAIVEHGDKTLISVEWGQGYSAGANAAFASMAAEARTALADIGGEK